MPKAGEIAKELRRIADALETIPDADLPRPMVAFYADSKEDFTMLASSLPRPLKKKVRDANDDRWAKLVIECNSMTSVQCYAEVSRNKMCTLIEPAKPAVYDCHPLLSTEEESLLEVE